MDGLCASLWLSIFFFFKNGLNSKWRDIGSCNCFPIGFYLIVFPSFLPTLFHSFILSFLIKPEPIFMHQQCRLWANTSHIIIYIGEADWEHKTNRNILENSWKCYENKRGYNYSFFP